MILPKNDHFKVTMSLNCIMGLWPFVFKDQPLLRTLYKLYATFVLSVFIVFVTSASIDVAIFVKEGKHEELIENLCTTLLSSMILLKAIVIRKSNFNLVKQAMDIEENIYKERDEEVIEKYNLYVRLTHRTNVVYIITASFIIVCHFTFPLLTSKEVVDATVNHTVTVGNMPISAWLPWDTYKHYWSSYVWLAFSGGVAATHEVLIDIFMFSLIIFPSGQIEILMHCLRNLPKYSRKVQIRLGCSRDEASYVAMRGFVLKHKDIIRYVENYNAELRQVTLFDFTMCSLQLATLTVELVKPQNGFLDFIHWGGFVCCMLLRLLVYYWHANEIMVKSSNLGAAIWEGDWFKEPPKVKRLMLLMIVRSQRPLSLEIGHFTNMTLNRFLGIVKGAYSYVMIMYR